MSDETKTREILDRLKAADPKRHAEHRSVVRTIMGLEPLYPPLPDTMSPLDKIKLYAREGFLHRADGPPEDFERLWLSAFPEAESKGGNE